MSPSGDRGGYKPFRKFGFSENEAPFHPPLSAHADISPSRGETGVSGTAFRLHSIPEEECQRYVKYLEKDFISKPDSSGC